MTEEVPLEVKAISIIRNHFEQAAAEITELLSYEQTLRLKAHVEVTPLEGPKIGPIQEALGKDLSGLVYFEDTAEYIIINPRQYLGSDNFSKISAIVRDQFNGEYISAGKDSHWRVTKTGQPLPISQPIPQFDTEDLMKHAWKGRKRGHGQYEEGSISYGWDFRDQFKPETIKVLEQDAILNIGEYEFQLTEKIVQARKIR